MNNLKREHLDDFYNDISSVSRGKKLTAESIYALNDEERAWRFFLYACHELNFRNFDEYKFLDSGCGDGRAISRLEEMGALPENCYGVDGSDYIISYAKKKNNISKFDCAMLTEIPYENESFDIVLSLGVFNHFLNDEDIVLTIKELRRVMKSGSPLFVSVPGKFVKYNGMLEGKLRGFNVEDGDFQKMFSDGFEFIGGYGYGSPITNYNISGVTMNDFFEVEKIIHDTGKPKAFYILCFMSR